MKVLYYGEGLIETGLGQISKNHLPLMYALGHDIEVVAMNQFNDHYDHERYPYIVHQCPKEDAYNTELAIDRITNGDYDLLFLSADINPIIKLAEAIKAARLRRDFKVIAYTCTDADHANRETFECLLCVDRPIVYSRHSKKVISRYVPELAPRLQTIYIGTEPHIFYPVSEAERRQLRHNIFSIDEDTFLVGWFNRNQWRKDPARALSIFHQFHLEIPNSLLYMHCKMHDHGGFLPGQARYFGMKMKGPECEVIFTHPGFNETVGVTRERLNLLYNCADVLISTSLGEGFGITTTEAMSAQIPIVGPKNTTFIELLGTNEERGYLAECGGTDNFAVAYGISDNPRPTVQSASMIDKLDMVYTHRRLAKEKAHAAREWTLAHTWDHVLEGWAQVIKEVEP